MQTKDIPLWADVMSVHTLQRKGFKRQDMADYYGVSLYVIDNVLKKAIAEAEVSPIVDVYLTDFVYEKLLEYTDRTNMYFGVTKDDAIRMLNKTMRRGVLIYDVLYISKYDLSFRVIGTNSAVVTMAIENADTTQLVGKNSHALRVLNISWRDMPK